MAYRDLEPFLAENVNPGYAARGLQWSASAVLS
jgi:hypothetical protein